MKQLIARCVALITLACGAHSAWAGPLCSNATFLPEGLPTALKIVTDLTGVLPEDDLPNMVVKIHDLGDGIGTIADLNQLCADVKDKDWVAAYLDALPFVASMSAAEVAPLVSTMADLAGRELEAIKKLTSGIGMAQMDAPAENTYSVSIDKYVWYWFNNSSLAPSEVSKHVVRMSLVAFLGTTSQEFELDTCYAGGPECKDNRLRAGTGGDPNISELVGTNGLQWLLRVKFKNNQWFLIPIDTSSINFVSTTEIAAPFLLKNGRYYYNK